MLYNCAPLSFLDVDQHDYASAMLGVYERLDVSLAVDLFAWTYRRSIRKYAVVLESAGAPDPFRTRHREHLTVAVQRVVQEGQSASEVRKQLDLPPADVEPFQLLLQDELQKLTPFNCARYRLTLKSVDAWVGKGRRYQQPLTAVIPAQAGIQRAPPKKKPAEYNLAGLRDQTSAGKSIT